MSRKAVKNKSELPAGAARPETFGPAVISASVPLDEILTHVQNLYDQDKAVFLGSTLNDETLPRKAKTWEESSRQLVETAGTLFLRSGGSYEKKEKALEIMNTCRQDSSIRAKNLALQFEAALREDPENIDRIDYLRKAFLESAHSFNRYDRTQQSYLNRLISAPDYMTPELRIEKEYSESAAKRMRMVPRGHIFLPARPYPPARIPEGEQVPYYPAPYNAWKALPDEDFIYDCEHDEFVLPEGYVSKDGRIDDKSVVWDWENNLVTMKFVGGEPITWPFWKPKDTYDVLREGDWCAEYYIRLYERFLKDIEPPGMRDGD